MNISNKLFSNITEIQSEAAEAVVRILRKNSQTKSEQVSTEKETYIVSVGKPGGGFYLSIDDGMDTLNEYKIDLLELVSILQKLEERFSID